MRIVWIKNTDFSKDGCEEEAGRCECLFFESISDRFFDCAFGADVGMVVCFDAQGAGGGCA